jgi:hypothetical protein
MDSMVNQIKNWSDIMENKKEFISLYKICEELFKEKKDKHDFENYYREVLKKVKEIFIKMGVDNEVLKKVEGGNYSICINQKEKMKQLIESYTSPSMKLVRKNKFEDIPISDLQSIVVQIEEIIKGTLDDEQYQEERNRMYMVTKYPFLKKMDEVRKEGITQVIKDMEEIKPIFKGAGLNEMDKVYLLNYYKDLLINASSKWRSVVEILSENRINEINELCMSIDEKSLDKMYEEDSNVDVIKSEMIKKVQKLEDKDNLDKKTNELYVNMDRKGLDKMDEEDSNVDVSKTERIETIQELKKKEKNDKKIYEIFDSYGHKINNINVSTSLEIEEEIFNMMTDSPIALWEAIQIYNEELRNQKE